MNIAILGFGRDGKAAYDYWSNLGHELTICDNDDTISVPTGAKTKLGEDYLDNLNNFDLVIRSAGIPPKKIQKANPNILNILDKVTGNIDEFFRVSPSTNIIGVTGTKGKGTTSTLITKILEECGKRVHLGGNIGIPALNLLKEDIAPEDWIVLEQSSYQLIDQKHSPHIAVCLMVVPEHLDWHTDLDEYIDAKSQLFIHQNEEDIAIYYAKNETSEDIANASEGIIIPYGDKPGAIIENGNFVIDGHIICSTNDIKLLGKHNWQNICAAITAVWQIDKNVDAISNAIKSFKGLPHRLELVTEKDGISYYNDSFASTPEASLAALTATPECKVMIIGGYDRQLPLDDLVSGLKKNENLIRQIILIGDSKERLANSLKTADISSVTITDAVTMKDIVKEATTFAQTGDSVMLSPGFASFDMFKDFEDRGEQYKEVVLSS